MCLCFPGTNPNDVHCKQQNIMNSLNLRRNRATQRVKVVVKRTSFFAPKKTITMRCLSLTCRYEHKHTNIQHLNHHGRAQTLLILIHYRWTDFFYLRIGNRLFRCRRRCLPPGFARVSAAESAEWSRYERELSPSCFVSSLTEKVVGRQANVCVLYSQSP